MIPPAAQAAGFLHFQLGRTIFFRWIMPLWRDILALQPP